MEPSTVEEPLLERLFENLHEPPVRTVWNLV